MKLFILTVLIGFLLISCEQKKDIKTLRTVFSQTHYDPEVIQNLPLYDSLKDIIISNFDTIYKFRNARNFVYHANGKDSKTIREDAYYYQFNYDYGEKIGLDNGSRANDQKLVAKVNMENLPAFIYPSIDRIFKKLGKYRIRGFDLSYDSTIEISIKDFHKEKENVDIGHRLIWKRKDYYPTSDEEYFYLDTTIAPNWRYHIYIDQNIEW